MKVLCSALALLALAADAGELFKLKDVTVVYADVYDAKPKSQTFASGRTAADNLAKALSKATGANVRFCSEARETKDAGPRIYLGPTRAAAAAGYDAGALRRLDARIAAKGRAAYIVANTHIGAEYGVAEFLERFADYYFIWIDGNDPFTVDSSRGMPACDFVARPGIYYREAYTPLKDMPGPMREFQSRSRTWAGMGDGGEIEGTHRVCCIPGKLNASHSNYCYCDPDVYYKDHPEYFSLNGQGQRVAMRQGGSQLCLSNPELFEVVFSNLCRFVELERQLHPGDEARIFDFSQQDCTGYICCCENCKREIARYNRVPGGHAEGGDAGLQFDFVNRLARRVRTIYPEVRMRSFAYVNTNEPPEPDKLKLEDNVIVWLCDMYGVSDHQLPLESPYNEPQAEIVRKWSKIAKHLQIWDYSVYRPETLDLQVDAYKHDAKFFRDHGVDFLFTQTHYNGQPFWELNNFVQFHMYFDPDRDAEALVDIFCRGYGAAAGEMRALIDFVRRTIAENPPRNAAEWNGRTLPWLSDRAALEKMRALAQAAYDKLPAGLERMRVAKALAGAERQLITCLKRQNGSREALPALIAAYGRHEEEGLHAGPYTLKGHEKTFQKKIRNVQDTVEMLDMRFDDLPKELGSADPASLYLFDYHLIPKYAHLYDAWKTNEMGYATQKIVDPSSTRGRAAFTAWGEPRLFPQSGGTSNRARKHGHWEGGLAFDWPADILDGRYHWVKAKTPRRISRNSVIFFEKKFRIGLEAGAEVFMDCDGFEKDPNWFEIWISARFQGPDYVKGDTRPNAYVVDRAVLRRLPEPPPDWEKLRPPPDVPQQTAAPAKKPMRLGWEFCVAHGKVPKLETAKRMIDFAATLGYDQVQLFSKAAFLYEKHPEAALGRSPYTWRDIRELDDYCAAKGIELVPYQACFSHMEPWFAVPKYNALAEAPMAGVTNKFNSVTKVPMGLCASNPKAFELLEDIWDELLPNFRSPYLNVGCDEFVEYQDGGRGSAAAVKEKGAIGLYTEVLRKMEASIRRRGKTMMCWADIVVRRPDGAEVLKQLPKSAVLMDWGYAASYPFEKECAILEESGHRFWVCPGTGSWWGFTGYLTNMMTNVSTAWKAGRKHGAEGLLLTTWGDCGHPQPWLAELPGMVYAAACVREGKELTKDELAARLDKLLGCKCGETLVGYGMLNHLFEKRRGGVLATVVRTRGPAMNVPGVTAKDIATVKAARRAAEAKLDLTGAAEWISDDFRLMGILLDAFEWRVAGDDRRVREELPGPYAELWLKQNRPGGLSRSIEFNLLQGEPWADVWKFN